MSNTTPSNLKTLSYKLFLDGVSVGYVSVADARALRADKVKKWMHVNIYSILGVFLHQSVVNTDKISWFEPNKM